MSKQYEVPKAELVVLSAEDVVTTSPGLLVGDNGTTGGVISFNDWLGKIGDNGEGSDGLEIDMGDLGL